MIEGLRFDPIELPEGSGELRAEVRAFMAEERKSGTLANRTSEDDSYCPEFSERLGERGWIAMMWPKKYGGHERSALERYVVNEELLVAAAPITAHFVADRQSGPLLLRFGNEDQREAFLPRMARGELTFCIGMSEPNAGSDLAAVETTATRSGDGWRINGTKLWTSWAHKAHYMIALVRTTPKGGNRHEGLSQFMVDLSLPGIEIRPIYSLAGHHHFNEVVFDECLVPNDMLVGEEGNGWTQVMGELGYERSGPERFLTTFQLYTELVRAVGPDPTDAQAEIIGRFAAHLMTLRSMSISVAGMLQAGLLPRVESSLVKDLGTNFEREIPETARLMFATEASANASDAFEKTLADAILGAPNWTIQGGSREILRTVISRGIGL